MQTLWFPVRISSRKHRHLINIVKRNTKTDGMGPFNYHHKETIVISRKKAVIYCITNIKNFSGVFQEGFMLVTDW